MKTPNFRKPLAVAALVAAFALTGCADKPVPDAPTPSPTAATQSATPSASATPIELSEGEPMESINPSDVGTADPDREMTELDEEKRAGKNTALDINPRDALKYADADVFATYPESEFDLEKGIEIGLGVYYDISTMNNFYMERDASKDYDIIHNDLFTGRINADFMNHMKATVAEAGSMEAFIPATPSSGVKAADLEGNDLKPTGAPTSTYNIPEVSISESPTETDTLTIRGTRQTRWEFPGGYTGTQPVIYWVQVIPSGDTWEVVGIGYTSDEKKKSELFLNGENLSKGNK